MTNYVREDSGYCGWQGKKEHEKSAKDLVELNSNCTGLIIPEIGHGVPLAKPDFFNHLVETWILEGRVAKECVDIIKR